MTNDFDLTPSAPLSCGLCLSAADIGVGSASQLAIANPACEEHSPTEELIRKRDEAANAYYSGDAESPLTDDAFDLIVNELERRGVDEQVGHGVAEGKVKHLRPMLSLKKVHTAAAMVELADQHPSAPYIVEPKWDGLAVSVRYDDSGSLAVAVRRGNGLQGDDVTAAVRAIFERQGIPLTLSGAAEVRGEIVMRRSAFHALNAKIQTENAKFVELDGRKVVEGSYAKAKARREFSNPRNAASGLLGRKSPDAATEAGRWLSFLTYDASGAAEQLVTPVSLTNESGHEGIPALDVPAAEGRPFVIIQLAVSALRRAEATPAMTIPKAVDWLAEHGDVIDVETDGVVFKFLDAADRSRLGESHKYPKWALAFKYPNRPKVTTLRAVKWSETRTGRVVPTAVFDTVEFGGDFGTVAVSRATLNNVEFLEEMDLMIGDAIQVTRANEVIPNVIGRFGEHATDAVAIDIPSGYERVGRDLRHTGRNTAAEVSFAAERLDLLGFGEETVTRLLDEHTEVADFADLLVLAHQEGLRPFERATSSLAAKLNTELMKADGSRRVEQWIAAAGIHRVGRRAGVRLAQAIVAHPSFDETLSPFAGILLLSPDELAAIDGFGESMSDAIVGAEQTWRDWDRKLSGVVTWDWAEAMPKSAEDAAELPWAGKKVLVTGSLPTLGRKETPARIAELGGTPASSVSKSLDILVVGENAGSKLAKAQAIPSIRIVSGELFESGSADELRQAVES